VLRIFGPKREEVTGGWRKLKEDFNNFYFSPDIKVIQSRRKVCLFVVYLIPRATGHVASMDR
jgi:hypothetical protein